MLKRLLIVGLLLSFHAFAIAQVTVPLNDSTDRVDLLSYERYYLAEPTIAAAAPENPKQLLKNLGRSERVDRVKGGGYWFYFNVKNQSAKSSWVLNVYDSIVDTIEIYAYYPDGRIETIQTGFLEKSEYLFSYGVNLELPVNESVDILLFMQSRYFPDNPRIELTPQTEFISWIKFEYTLVIGCFGAILILSFYNFFLGFWVKDRSYFYYSLYLLCSLAAWMGAYNATAEWFDIYSYWSLLPPFYLLVAFNILYFIHFLELRSNLPIVTRWLYGLVIMSFLLCIAMPLFDMGQYMMIYGGLSALWVLVALGCGIYRYLQGYRPARFFVLAFTILALGVLVTLLPIFFPQLDLEREYLVSIITQTIDMLLLSLALADRINLLREDKELALTNALQLEVWATEKEQQANVKLQQALDLSEEESQRKTDFLRMVSHELRTPLYSIMASVEQWDVLDDEQQHRDLLYYMSYGAARLRMQVDNLVLLAETDDDSLEPTLRSFEVRPLFESLAENARGLLHERVQFHLLYSESIPSQLKSDSYLLQHMLRTVIDNACKYTEFGRVELRVDWFDGELTVQIVDTGCGMSREQERNIFQDFVQVSRGLERDSEGLGIGLTVCYRLSEVLGANLSLSSALGEGTRVNISIPLEQGESTTVTTGSVKQAKVLIVEDNLVNAQILESLLESMGACPDIVNSGQSALAAIQDVNYDLILMDLQMPVMDGVTATRWIRQRGYLMPVVAVTANSDSAVRKRCAAVGMNDFLVKPLRRSDLQRVMERQLDEYQHF